MTLNLLKTSDTYFNRLFNNPTLTQGLVQQALPGAKAKVLLLDEYTTPVVSMCYTTTQLLSNDVVLVEVIEKQNSLNPMKHLQCICYLKPTNELVQSLVNELKNPHYSSYQIFFNNTVSKSQLEKLATLDEFELVTLVVEVFQDYLTINDNLFNTTNKQQPFNTRAGGNNVLLESSSIVSLLLLLKKCPVIKYELNSKDLRKLSLEILYTINSNSNNNLFDDLNNKLDSPPILLLLDRKNDPITPLLSPWTYQSMIHELIGILKNVVKLGEEQLTLSESSDLFYKESMYLNFGDLTDKVQKYVEEYKLQTKQTSTENLKNSNLSDLKNFLIKFPEFKKFSSNVSKHLNLVSELDRVINDQRLWDLGELQQIIAAGLETHHSIKLKIHQVLDNYNPPEGPPQQKPFSTINKVKLVLLYAMKYVNISKPENETDTFVNKLSNDNLTSPPPSLSQLSVIRSFKKYLQPTTSAPNLGIGGINSNNNHNTGSGPTSSRSSTDGLGLFNGKKLNELFNKNNNNSNSPQPDNIYMQHTPKIFETLNHLIPQTNSSNTTTQGSTDDLTTLVPETVTRQYGSSISDSIQDVIIYIKGGVTYEEARVIHEMNKTNINTKRKVNLIVGGDSMLNSSLWLENLIDLVNKAETNALQELPTHSTRSAQLRDLL